MKIEEIEKLLADATPGPWFAHATDDDAFANARFVSDKPGEFCHDDKQSLTNDRDENENIIAVTLWQGRGPYIDEKNGRENANARLIAAEPTVIRELVELVKVMRDVIKAAREVNISSQNNDPDSSSVVISGHLLGELNRTLVYLDCDNAIKESTWAGLMR